MRKVTLFIAMSLDGYIADSYGNVDWITGHDEKEENLDVYSSFIKNIDTVIMGWNTYHQIVTELSPEKWVYNDMTSYVFTHHDLQSTHNIIFIDDHPSYLISDLKLKSGKGIWICGGAHMIVQLLQDDNIDEFYISVIPTLLGNGMRLFESLNKRVDLIYQRR